MEQKIKPGKWLYGLAAGIFFIGGIAFFVMWTLGTQNYLRQEQTLADNSTSVLVIAVGMGGLALCLVSGIVVGLVAFFLRRSARKAAARPSGPFAV
jgi:hypothetical protein